MDTINYSEAKRRFAALMEQVNDDRAPMLITRGGSRPCVLMSFDEYQALAETAYLMRSPANARHLMGSIAALDAGRGAERTLQE